MKILLYLMFLIFFCISFSYAEQKWIKKKDKNIWISKKETKKMQWITKKNKKDDLVYIIILPLFFTMLHIKRFYDK